ncbi:DUF4350 domain-containing protein [Arthrobacter tumbae]|uniref:DUF4350 domain-containing protein n=1 Tax=Arthrobacter tumbae TaxID=163874 RepID=UPI001957C880|nr:DUF4350 domain-containing protein [Arthrobacter tumbae]MBM7780150.1 hypothetical protein [Arthrobacter tumbae]
MSGTTETRNPPAGAHGGSAGAEVVGDGQSVRSTFLATLKRARGWIALGFLLGIAVLIGALAAGSGAQDPLSPDNAAPVGARAAAEVLDRSGVEVVRAGSLEDAVDALQGSDDTLLLHDPQSWLTSEQLGSLGGGIADRTVLIEPSLTILTELAGGIRSAGVVPADIVDPLQADCANAAARAAAAVSPGGFSYRGAVTCFPLPGDGDGDAAGTFATTADGTVGVLGNGEIISNGRIDEHGNAALTLRVLGSTETLVWYQPTQDDLAVTAGPADPLSLLPDFVNPLMLWLLLTALLAILWRARRLGPLVTEPLPVVVRSAETAAGRARLYQDAGAVHHAAETLRAGTLTRLAAALRIPPAHPRASIVAAATAKTSRDPAELDWLLNSHSPHSDAQLVQWSQELDKLEQEIRRS